jgi:hypothetical protein
VEQRPRKTRSPEIEINGNHHHAEKTEHCWLITGNSAPCAADTLELWKKQAGEA